MARHTPFAAYHGGKYSKGWNASSPWSAIGFAIDFATLKAARPLREGLLATHRGDVVRERVEPSRCWGDRRSDTKLSLLLNAARLSRGRRELVEACEEGGGLCEYVEDDEEPEPEEPQPDSEVC